ncbi:MAG TPA: cyclopropane fatty acyl phospholipid synthase [Chthoniobacterales bacterium]|nr:cyclopropane fatty acyl phospholipid synthase [Chthoniobacterales bacterium]
MAGAREAVENLLRAADIEIDGARPCDIQVHDERFFPRVLAGGTLGFGETYMDGWWDCAALDEMCCRAIRARVEQRFSSSFANLLALATSLLINRQTRARSREVGEKHYDLGNDFFQAMLDPWLQYSCALFHEGDDLAAAQERKLEMICQRPQLRPGDRLLDIGCGWGGLAKYAAQNYGCSVVGLTVSREQQQFAQRWCSGLEVQIQLRDYREIEGRFDRAVSVGMVEHVGFKNYRTYLAAVFNSLGKEGRFLCQGICNPISSWQLDPWIHFSELTSPVALPPDESGRGNLLVEDVFNLGPHYDPTLMAWEENFRRPWPRFAPRYDERFRRMWGFYLLSCAGAFRARSLQVYSILFAREGTLARDSRSRPGAQNSWSQPRNEEAASVRYRGELVDFKKETTPPKSRHKGGRDAHPVREIRSPITDHSAQLPWAFGRSLLSS